MSVEDFLRKYIKKLPINKQDKSIKHLAIIGLDFVF